MLWTLGRIKARVRNLLDDPQGTYLTDDFLVPLINEVYSDADLSYSSTQNSWDISVIEIPDILPGTPNLAAYQADGAQLSGLIEQPERIDWKVAGNDASYYQLASNFNVLPDLQPQAFLAGWEYRAGVIWLTPCSVSVDLRIRGQFEPQPLTDDSSVLTSDTRMGLAVSYGTAALVAAVRGNAAWEQAYNAKYEEALDDIMADAVKATQGQARRIGRQSRSRAYGSNAQPS